MGGLLNERKAIAPDLYHTGWGRTNKCYGGRKRGRWAVAIADPTDPVFRFSKRAVQGRGVPAAFQASSRVPREGLRRGRGALPQAGPTQKRDSALKVQQLKSRCVRFATLSHSFQVGQPGGQGPPLPTSSWGPVTCVSRRGRRTDTPPEAARCRALGQEKRG